MATYAYANLNIFHRIHLRSAQSYKVRPQQYPARDKLPRDIKT